MKLYTDLDIPLWKWDKIQESQEKDGELDLRYLKVGDMPRKYNKKEYLKAYMSILNMIPGIDVSLNESWTLYLAHYIKYRILVEMNLWKKLWYKKKLEIQTNDLNRVFNNYLEELQSSNKDFEFKVCGLIKDYKEKWDLDIPIPKILQKKDKFQFFLIEEYVQMIREWIEESKLTLDAAIKLMMPEFIDKFIYEKTIKVNDLKKIDKRLYDFFRDTKEIKKWRLIRGDFFSLDKLKYKTNKKNNILKQVITLREVNNQAMPMKGENAVTLREYLEQIDRLNDKSKEQKKELKKRKQNAE